MNLFVLFYLQYVSMPTRRVQNKNQVQEDSYKGHVTVHSKDPLNLELEPASSKIVEL